jgi:hypothetical protein
MCIHNPQRPSGIREVGDICRLRFLWRRSMWRLLAWHHQAPSKAMRKGLGGAHQPNEWFRKTTDQSRQIVTDF